MSQHDMNIANQGFPAFRSDLNNALTALASNSSGDTPPSTTYANQFWYETDTNTLYFRNEDNDAWITLAVFDQTNDEWEIRTAVIQAVDSGGVQIKTDDGTARITVADNGNVTIGGSITVGDSHTIGDDASDNLLILASSNENVVIEGNGVILKQNDTQGLRLNDNNDISFYEDTGSDIKFFWDASAESLGIGTSSPAYEIHILNSSADAEQMIESTASTYNSNLRLKTINNGSCNIIFGDNNDSNVGGMSYDHSGDYLTLSANNAERMRLDSSGNLLFDSGYGSVATAYGVRAWVNFNGTGTVAIREDGNVSSVTDNATGSYNVNFSTAMPDANYCVNTTCSADGTNDNRATGTDRTANTTSFVRVYSYQTVSQSKADEDVFCVAVFR